MNRKPARIFESLSAFLIRLTRRASKNPGRIAVVGVPIVAFCLGMLSQLETVLSIEKLVDLKFSSGRYQKILENEFNEKPDLSIRFQNSSTDASRFSASTRAIETFLSTFKREHPEIDSELSPLELRKPALQEKKLWYPKIEDLSETPWKGIVVAGSKERGKETAFSDFVVQWQVFSSNETWKTARAFESAFSTARKETPDLALVSAHLLGNVAFQNEMQSGLQVMGLLNAAVLILIFFGLRVLFGSFKAGMLYAFSLFVTAIAIHGIMAIVGIPVDILTNSLFLMTAVAALEDFVFLSMMRVRSNDGLQASLQPFFRLVVPCFLTSLTTFIGFGSLGLSSINVISRFGIAAALAAMIEWAVLFLVLPAMIRSFPTLGQWTNPSRARLLEPIDRLAKMHVYRWVAALAMGVFFFAPHALKKLNIYDHPIEIFPKTNPMRAAAEEFHRAFGWIGSVSVVFPPEANDDSLGRARSEIQKLSEVKAIEDPVEQRSYLIGGLAVETQQMIDRESLELPFRRRLISSNEYRRFVIYLADIDTRTLSKTRSQLQRICESFGCFVAGDLIRYEEFSNEVPKTLLESLVMSFILVALTLALLAYGIRRSNLILPVCIASAWGPIAMLAVVSIAQVKINFLTCIFATVLVGLTGDNAIQFLWEARRKNLNDALADRGPGALQCTLLMALGASIFLGSAFDPPKIFGVLLAFGLIASVIGDLYLFRFLTSLRFSFTRK